MEQWLRNADTIRLEVQGLGPGGRIPYQERGSWIEAIEYLPTKRAHRRNP